MQILKAYKFRIYPTEEQQKALSIQFGCARFVYNHYRRVREEYYFETNTGLTYVDCANDLSDRLKPENDFLKQADSQVLQQTLKDLDRAYVNFFEGRADYPKFKRKNFAQSIRYPQRFKLDGEKIYLPKVGWVKVVRHRRIAGEMKNCTVSRTATGKYFVSIQCEITTKREPVQKPESVGIDLGLKHFAILSTDEKIDNPKHLNRAERRLKIRQRRLCRKMKGSNSRVRTKHAVATIHEKVANQRKDFHHKTSRMIVDRFGVIGLEDLNVKGMVKNGNLAKSINDVGWSQFVNFVGYKAKWAGAEVVKHDRWFASSKICSDCGAKNQSLVLSDRMWVCASCGVVHDRDANAAKNLNPKLLREPQKVTPVEIRAMPVRNSAPEKLLRFQQPSLFSLEAQAL